jgi:hypothetical protein
MKVFRTAVIIALLAAPAYGQDTHIPRYGEEDKPKSATELQADKAAERAYKNSLGNIPDAGPTDPWGNARSTGAPKAAAKDAAKPVAKTPVAKTEAKTAPAKPIKAGTTPN